MGKIPSEGLRFNRKDYNQGQLLAANAAQRRAVAQFHELLRAASNRKLPYRNRSSVGRR
jgi:hypothetical protein